MEEALELFKLPRNVGEFEEKTMTVAIGRFGPYIKHDNKFFSLPKDVDPMSVSAAECQQIIEEKRQQEKNNKIKTFEQEPELQVLNGRFGPYIAYKGKNYKIPKSMEPASLSLEDALKIVSGEIKAEKTAFKGKKTKK